MVDREGSLAVLRGRRDGAKERQRVRGRGGGARHLKHEIEAHLVLIPTQWPPRLELGARCRQEEEDGPNTSRPRHLNVTATESQIWLHEGALVRHLHSRRGWRVEVRPATGEQCQCHVCEAEWHADSPAQESDRQNLDRMALTPPRPPSRQQTKKGCSSRR